MKFSMKTIVVGSFFSLVLVLAVAPQIFAQDVETYETETTQETQPTQPTQPQKPSRVTAENEREVRQEVRREKLNEKKIAVCENRQEKINAAMVKMVDRSQKHFDRITNIYEISTSFYTQKGLTVAGYETLIANVEAAKAAASAANEYLSAAPKLLCESDGPQADLQAFRNARLDKVKAFNAYRDDVKTLVKAIRDVAKAAEPTTESNNGGAY